MPIYYDKQQTNGTTLQIYVATLTAGATLFRVELNVTLSYQVDYPSSYAIGFSPPNVLHGIVYGTSPVTIPVITTSNWNSAPFLISGYGITTSAAGEPFITQTTNPISTTRWIATRLFYEGPVTNSAAFDIGYAVNWLGAGYYGSTLVESFFNIDFRAYAT